MVRLIKWAWRKCHPTVISLKRIALGSTQLAPSIVVIGAQKSGTTSLFEYLSLHPEVEATQVKELDYFNSLGNRRFDQTEYHQNFPWVFGRQDKRVSMDVSPAYMLDANAVVDHIWSYNPEIKIVASLRDPVSRAISAWFMYKRLYDRNPNWFMELEWVKNRTNQGVQIHSRKAKFGESFVEDMKEEISVLQDGNRIDMPIVEYGLYETQLRPFYEKFGSENIHLIDSDALAMSTQNVLAQVLKFAGLSHHTWKTNELVKHFKGDNKGHIDQSSLDFLHDFYMAPNRRLADLSQNDFPWLEKYR